MREVRQQLLGIRKTNLLVLVDIVIEVNTMCTCFQTVMVASSALYLGEPFAVVPVSIPHAMSLLLYTV